METGTSKGPLHLRTLNGTDAPTSTLGEIGELYLQRNTAGTITGLWQKGAGGTWGQVQVAAGTSLKKYVAKLTQTGTSAPTAAVLENTLGGTLVWTYTSVGKYKGTLAGAFPTAAKVVLSGTIVSSQGNSMTITRLSADEIEVTTYDATDTVANALLAGDAIEISVYA